MAKTILKRPRVLVVADTAPSSRVLEWWGGGGWSHYANMLNDGTIIDARSDRTLAMEGWDYGNGKIRVNESQRVPAGVWRRPGDYLRKVEKFLLMELPCSGPVQYDHWEHALLSQIGKPYDKIGIVDFLTGSVYDRNWREQTAWFCDELGLWAIEEAQICAPIPLPIFRFTPGSALAFVLGMGAKVIASGG